MHRADTRKRVMEKAEERLMGGRGKGEERQGRGRINGWHEASLFAHRLGPHTGATLIAESKKAPSRPRATFDGLRQVSESLAG